ncbi:MAG TPA: response regulator [Smithellaceae bacterium]|nr:response regulator [Smithellaceae bacterium]
MEMTHTEVVSVKIKKEERPKEIYAIASITPYEDMDKKVNGNFILGFNEKAMAILVTQSIAHTMGMPPVNDLGDDAFDILNEFMNTIVGNAISEWDEFGFRVKFRPPTSVEYYDVPAHLSNEVEKYVIILQLDINYIAFRVTFSEVSVNKLKDKRILVVDDSRMVRGILERALKQREVQVELAENGQDAIEKFKTFKPDLTVMDINMPVMGGLDAIIQIRSFAPTAKFVILSSSSRKDEVVTAQTLDVSSYVTKPFKAEELFDALIKALA